MKKTLIFGSVLAAATVANAQTFLSSLPQVTLRSTGVYDITDNLTLTANNEYILEGTTFVNAGHTLTIEEGVIVRGQPRTGSGAAGNPGTLVVSRGASIDAEGTSTNPIIFTTAMKTDGSPWNGTGTFLDASPKTAPLEPTNASAPNGVTTNLWGSVVLLGYAPINTGTVDTNIAGEAYIEGLVLQTEDSTYGGRNPNDNSGIVRYVSIRHSGAKISDGDELQGLTLGGVGYGTLIEYVDIYCSGDDGIEIFGGTATVKNFMLSYCDDDGLDLDQGYQGLCQFGFILLDGVGIGNTDKACEWDGDDDITDDQNNVSLTGQPFAHPTIANLTIFGSGTVNDGGAIKARQGFGGTVINCIVANFANNGIFSIDNTGTANTANGGYPSVLCEDQVAAGTLTFSGLMFYDCSQDSASSIASGGAGTTEESVILGTIGNCTLNQVVADGDANDPNFAAFVDTTNPNGPVAGVWASQTTLEGLNPIPQSSTGTTGIGTNAIAYSNLFFDSVNYIGAFAPGYVQSAWTTGWTAMNVRNILVDNGIAQNLL